MTETMDYTPARVHIVQDDTREIPKGKPFLDSICKTYLAGATPELIVPRSPSRREVTIAVLGVVGTAGNVVLCDNEADASAAAIYSGTIVGTIPGAIWQPGMIETLCGQDEIWLARAGTTGTAPLVSVITVNER